MKKMKQDPEQVMKNLRRMMKEAEEMLAQSRDLDEDDVSEIKARLQGGVDRLRESYDEMGGRLRDYYSEMEDRITDYYNEIEERLRESVESTEETIRSHPYQTIALTFGAGVILGALLRGSRR